jgi:hypothetical protein
VEFWEAAQYPEKLIICILQPLPNEAQKYIEELVKPSQIFYGIEQYVESNLIFCSF